MNRENGNPIDDLIRNGAAAQFTSLPEEYAAARGACAVFPGIHRAVTRASGEDRVSFLHGMLTSDVRSLTAGQGQPAAFLTDAGKVVTDLRLFCDNDGFDLDCLSWCLPALRGGLEKFLIADDVEIEESDDRAVLVCLEGPHCLALASTVFATSLDLAPFAAVDLSFDSRPVRLHAVSEIGGEGVMVVGALAQREAVFEACRGAGAQPAGLRALDVLRVEAGIPWAGVDMGEDTLLMEIGLAEAVSRTKGCYLGQEVVERVASRGQVNRTLTAFAIEADEAQLPAGAIEVRTDASAVVGRVTSWVRSPAHGGILGMGLLHRKGREAAALQAATPSGEFPCRIVEFPAARRS